MQPQRRLLVFFAVLATMSLTAPAAFPAPGDPFTCRASLARTEGFPVGALNQEPVVANAPNNPCTSENKAVVDALNPLVLPGGLGTVRALYAQTDANDGGNAQAGAAQVDLALPNAPRIRAAALTSEAHSKCAQVGSNAPKPNLTASSTVLFVQIGDDPPLVDVSESRTINLPGGITIFLNQQTTTSDSVTQRALRVETPAGTVTVAESVADFRGNPCDTGAQVAGKGGGKNGGGQNAAAECSDEKDNDGDQAVDFGNDPGCASPQDDDESNDDPPECSDGEDNDNDGRVDYPSDPGCESRADDDEQDSANPECSDGADNDADGKTDYPADSGCASSSDDDEAAGFLTGGGGYDEVDKKRADEDSVAPGSSLRFGGVLPCHLGDRPGPNLVASFHDPELVGRFKLAALTRAFCRNDPDVDPDRPLAEFDTYVGEGTGTATINGVDVPGVTVEIILIDRGEPGAPPVIGVDFFSIRVYTATVEYFNAVGTLDHGNTQAHTPGERFVSS